ncbi:prolyl oligopeptidase family-domain-containing protein [Syncephalis plumigaleata]|nr:prolyl oligopeptidase family-domain-containing protein [Syncephalis plumigaleata]
MWQSDEKDQGFGSIARCAMAKYQLLVSSFTAGIGLLNKQGNLHGYQIADPYRWLEDPNSANTKSFVEAQNKVTKDYLSKDKNAKAYKAEFDKSTLMKKYPYQKGKNQPDVYYQESLTSKREMFFDVNSLSKDGTTTISTIRSLPLDNALCKAGAQLKDTIEDVKFQEMAWTRDNSGFSTWYVCNIYRLSNADGNEGGSNAKTDANGNPMLYYHKVGTPQSEDRLMFKSTNSDDKAYMPTITDDGLWLILGIAGGSSEASKMHIAPMTQSKGVPEKLAFTKVVDNFDAAYYYLANEGKTFYFVTTLNAPRYRVATYNLDAPKRGFVDLIPQHETKIPGNVILLGKDKVAINYLNYSKSDVVIHDLKTGRRERDISSVLPVGSVYSMSSPYNSTELFIKLISYISPSTNYHYEYTTGKLTPLHEPDLPGWNSSEYQVRSILVPSKDGVQFPLTVVARKDINLDGSQPALLYGYGGFGINSTPKFDPLWVVFMKHFRGVVAIAGIRGGGEYGETWHQDGMLHKKQNSFDDFQSAARYLVKEGYTKPELLTIEGASNGGLLVAATFNQAPELFGCALATVGVMDMLRFHKFTVGNFWIQEYGNPDVKADFEYLRKYSPLHNVCSKKAYPAMLLKTGLNDDRVVPAHSYKLAAELQYKLPNNPNPLMLLVDDNSGHGSASNAQVVNEMIADLSFMALSLKLKWYP